MQDALMMHKTKRTSKSNMKIFLGRYISPPRRCDEGHWLRLEEHISRAANLSPLRSSHRVRESKWDVIFFFSPPPPPRDDAGFAWYLVFLGSQEMDTRQRKKRAHTCWYLYVVTKEDLNGRSKSCTRVLPGSWVGQIGSPLIP
jgi:hypothetical protein